MRPWSEQQKQALRHLAAARYFLPVALERADSARAEAQYQEFLHHTEWGLALDELAYIGEQYSDDPFQALFWSELTLAAQTMSRQESANEFRRRAEV
ncbi:hypothetical protein [Simplicispira metamorpha]|uniref:Uncharacterized protein n=1 Tax=Simplicispira metamorpha TaxID=80881 RepID=A0A4R2ND51_9BURK|nr:hypothetical protein [Simplicispira metamorpha]TCP19161.1 hypothetical protein EV674_1063 [Simplicispira metamorpha]